MPILATSPVIDSDVWQEDTIMSDVWQDQEDVFNPVTTGDLYAEYYLKQMNLLNGQKT